MKTILSLFFGFCLTVSAQTNYYGVQFYATNSSQVLAGYPQWEPIPNGVRALGMTTNGLATNEVLFTEQSLNQCVSSNIPAMSAYQQAQAALNPATTNMIAWQALYNQIPLGITDTSNRMTTLTNLYSSWLSGTNSATGTNNIIKQVIQNDYYTWVYLNQLINYLSKLGPGLQTIYNPANDPTGSH